MPFKIAEKARPNKSAGGQKVMWCPFAKVVEPDMPTQGVYPDLHPKGAIVHYTAGASGVDEIAYGRKMGYAYMLIDRTGMVYQAHPLNRWGYHAGESSWPSLGAGVSRHLVGIEIESAGLLTKNGDLYETWFKTSVPVGEVRHIPSHVDNCQPGYYQVYTAAQEASLVSLLLWLKGNCPTVFDLNLVLGHDEVAPTRKQDPGGALSATMPNFRKRLLASWEASLGPVDTNGAAS